MGINNLCRLRLSLFISTLNNLISFLALVLPILLLKLSIILGSLNILFTTPIFKGTRDNIKVYFFPQKWHAVVDIGLKTFLWKYHF